MDKQAVEESKCECSTTVCLIFSQGIIFGACYSLSDAVVLTYPQLPSYFILGLFTAAHIPITFEFLIAPFIEHYRDISYGKHKIWIVVSCSCISLLLFLMSRFTSEQHQIHLALLYLVMMVFATVHKVATISMSVKEIADPTTISFTQEFSFLTGYVAGSLLFLKMVSPNFSHYFGFKEPFCTTSTYFIAFGITVLVVTVITHFSLTETKQKQSTADGRSFWDTLKEYRVFFDTDNQYFRQLLFFPILNQGRRFFAVGFHYELIKMGFSKERMNELENLTFIPVMIIVYFASQIEFKPDPWLSIWLVLCCKFVVDVVTFVTMPTQIFAIVCFLFFTNLLYAYERILGLIIITSFPSNPFSGMFVVAMNSAWELGDNGALQQQIIEYTGWWPATVYGFFLQFVILSIYWEMTKWIKEGRLDKQDEGEYSHLEPNQEQRRIGSSS